MGNVVRCSVEFIDSCTAMFIGVAGLKEMILAFFMGDWILGDIVHWEVYMFDFFSKRENVVVGGIKVRDGIEGVKVGEKKD